eukprot:scpid28370/ scgid11633/ Ubiquitin carboxyl-terminal hydrolase 4; Deubiquitinating enzyme 4; Ubiquitin thioesterase 4; Ubiquitin-specific-processing protease 4
MASASLAEDSSGSAPPIIPSAEEQCNIVKPILRPSLKAGDWWYLLDSKWFSQWKKYVCLDTFEHSSYMSDSPGPIDLEKLLDNEGDLRENMLDELDYSLVPADVWDKLIQWFELMPGQEPIKRRVVEHGMFVKHCRVEVYQLKLKLKCHGRDELKPVVKCFSRSSTIQELMDTMKEVFDIDSDTDCRVWNQCTTSPNDLLTKMTENLMDSSLYDDQVIIVETRNADGSWPLGERNTYGKTDSSSAYTSPYSVPPISAGKTLSSTSPVTGGTGSSTTNSMSSTANSTDSSSRGFFRSSWFGSSSSQSHQPGLCGLSNLGNTCFMNSALQCMSNTHPLTKYFLARNHEKELNKDNPLGMKGLIATAYGELLEEMWNGRSSVTAPRTFKYNVGKFAPQFSGFAQHDSQELLAFLMDGLHEDLNRIKKKPYIETASADGRSDDVAAKEAWENHLKRNNSIIVDTFQGQFKSTLVCPKCQQVSIIFDPFMFLQLPLPVEKKRPMTVTVVFKDLSITPLMVRVSVPKSGTVSALLAEVAKVCELQADHLVLADVFGNRFHRLFKGASSLTSILNRDNIVAYELSSSIAETAPNGSMALLTVYSRRLKRSTYGGVYSSQSTTLTSMELFSLPQVLCVPRQETTTYSALHAAIAEHVRPLTNAPDEGPTKDGTLLQLANNSEEALVNGNDDINVENDTITSEDEANAKKSITMDDQAQAADVSKPEVFSMVYVNLNGTMEIAGLSDTSAVKLNAENYVGLNWAKDSYCDAARSLEVKKHGSCDYFVQEAPKALHLTDCMDLFLTEEQLGVNDPWFCPRCKEHQQAFKKFDLFKLPDVLVIQLKRFSYNSYWRDKIDQLVSFPVEGLDLSEHCKQASQSCVYDLHAVSNHYGGMGGGHYTAYAKNKETGDWYHFDDSSVKTVAKNVVVSKAAYVLFYSRRQDASSSAPACDANAASS